MKPPVPSLVKEWRTGTYPAIDPRRPELSHAGKTVVVTGAGTGVGKATAKAYATAGVSRVVIIGRRGARLDETKTEIEAEFSNTRVSCFVADVTDRVAVASIAKEVGEWHVLVLNAGYLSELGPAATANLDDWWKGFEVNVLGVVLPIQAFLPTKAPGSAIVGLTSAVVAYSGQIATGTTSYQASKMAMTRFLETFAAENPELYVGIVHPGAIGTEMREKGGKEIELDDDELPAHYIVWSTSPEGAFTSGKIMWANWDVDELRTFKDEIQNTGLLSSSILGFPWSGGPATLTKPKDKAAPPKST